MKRRVDDLSEESFRGGTLGKIFDLARRQCGITLSVVYPRVDGWGHIDINDAGPANDFCRIIRSTKDGAKHCKMCHVLMTVAACSQGMTEQTCHAGATVLVQPIEDDGEGGMALLSSCAFRHLEKEKAWKFVSQRAKQLGLSKEKIRAAFEKLPDLNEANSHCLCEIMPLARMAIKDLGHRMEMEEELKNLRAAKGKLSSGEHLTKEFNDVAAGRTEPFDIGNTIDDAKGKKASALIKVVCSLVQRRPQISYTVEDLALAARMTPNYFSSIFHKHTGQCFMDYLTDRRIELAQRLLLNPSMNVSEVASMCGYDDPGYFTRRFRKKTGMTPKAWREKGNTD